MNRSDSPDPARKTAPVVGAASSSVDVAAAAAVAVAVAVAGDVAVVANRTGIDLFTEP